MTSPRAVVERPTVLAGWGAALAAILTLAPLVGPGLIFRSGLYAPPEVAAHDDEDWRIIHTGPGLPCFRLPSREDERSSQLPVVSRSDFTARLPELRIEGKPLAAVDDLDGPAVVFLTPELRPGQTELLHWIVAGQDCRPGMEVVACAPRAARCNPRCRNAGRAPRRISPHGSSG